ncbi:TetR/AcrR family transcriptional regulator [Actinoalloteichus caeruleus]|uniref:TetR/AcrR family transcriptional regulator n=1 Tax=Actinoalloteichus cyanogriseus TaxID=2893586 RepID=UPI003AAF5DA0
MGSTGGRRTLDRERAIEQAMREFWRHGYEATSVSRLTQVLGIKPPSLYWAFGDKRGLFDEAVRHYQRTYGAFAARALDEEPNACAAVRRLLHECAVEYTDDTHPAGCLLVTAATTCGPESEDVRQALQELREQAKARLVTKIEIDVAAGELPSGTSPQGLGTYVAAVVQGMSAQARDGAGRETLRQVAELAMTGWPTTGPSGM